MNNALLQHLCVCFLMFSLHGHAAAISYFSNSNGSTSYQPDTFSYKQLAAPPEEMLAGHLNAPNPKLLGQHSTSALIPIHFSANQHTFHLTFPVESTAKLQIQLYFEQSDVRITHFFSPSHQVFNAFEKITIDTGTIYRLPDPETGQWAISLERTDTQNEHLGFVQLSFANSSTALYSYFSDIDFLQNKPFKITTLLYEQQEDALIGASNEKTHATLDPTHIKTIDDLAIKHSLISALMYVYLPSGQIQKFTMNPDIEQSLWQQQFTPHQSGHYKIQVVATGRSSLTGELFIRTTEQLIIVVPKTIIFDSANIEQIMQPNSTINDIIIDFNVKPTIDFKRNKQHPSRYLVSAELWGTDIHSQKEKPIVWFSGIQSLKQNEQNWYLQQHIDERWLHGIQMRPPFYFKHVYIKDIDSANSIIKIEQLETNQLEAFVDNTVQPPEITRDMLIQPSRTNTAQAQMLLSTNFLNAPVIVKKLLLIHGYCTAGIWPISHFSSDAVAPLFPYKNFSHDQYAQELIAVTKQYDSFGVIAHSQGALATMHIMAYYMSGLDYAMASSTNKNKKPLQAIGMPAKGTPLASKLALLGAAGGKGCGPNDNLTIIGAAKWLSGIPNSIRENVYFYTTSEQLNNGKYDTCDVRSDALLNNPDDGVVSKARAQLVGGNDMGHTFGECHSQGMTNPPQTYNIDRNTIMDSDAMR